MEKFDFIFLIISSDDLECYSKMREHARKYFNLYKDKIKYFFTELKDDIDCEICEKDDYIYVKGTECITPGMYIKTIKSMKYINENYNYDFIIRTNLSSLWNLNNLFSLKQMLPLNNFAGGFVIFNSFISGTGIILSKNVCIHLSNKIIIRNEFEDVYISSILVNFGYQLNNITNYKMEMLIDNTINVPILSESENILYYRIKNCDRNVDIQLFKILCKQIYNIE